MHKKKQKIMMPPWLENSNGDPRRVGLELEITGMELDVLSGHVADFYELSIENKGRYERSLQGDSAGEWLVELDFNYLKKIGRAEQSKDSLSAEVAVTAEELLALAAKAIVPLEVVSPPLPLDRLTQFESLIDLLRSKGAEGTSDSAVNAFGMQMNPELARLDPNHITACLKAFVCLYDWLLERAKIDLTRRITSYIDSFPGKYVKKLIDPDYWPDMDSLIDDYLLDNPTRNRALDMLPLFTYIDEERVLRKVDDELIKARPTFHYRLPNCEIDRPDWGLYLAWNDWVRVEELASDLNRLEGCTLAYRTHLNEPVKRIFTNWWEIVDKEWINL